MTERRSLTRFFQRPYQRWAAASAALAVVWMIAQTVLPKGAPLGPMLVGSALGAASALTAVGIVLIWRSAKIVNFAVGAMGAATGATSIRLFTAWGWNYALSLILGTLVGLLVGVLIDVAVIRRFTHASRLVATVATLGLAQLLGGIELVLPGAVFGKNTGQVTVGGYSTPLSRFRFTVGPTVLDGNHVLIGVLVPVVVVSLHAFLQRSRVGIATRAAAQNRQWAQLLGIPVDRLSMVTWGLAGALAALTYLLQAPFVGTVPQVSVGPGALLIPLAAALVARMESMSVACVAAIVLGALDQIVRWNAQQTPGLSDVVLLVVILGALMLRARDASRAHESEAQLQIAAPPRFDSAWLGEKGRRVLRFAGAAVALGAMIALPLTVSNSTAYTLSIASIWAIVAVSIVVVTGWTGQLTLGQFAIVGLSAAVVGNLLSRYHLDMWLALGAGMGVGMLGAAMVGVPALRIRGPFLGVATLAFAVVVGGYLLNPNYFPEWIPGDVARPVLLNRWSLEREHTMMAVCFAALTLCVIATASVRYTRSGRNLIAGRDNPKSLEAQAVSSRGTALSGFVFSGALAGLAGGLHVMVLHGVRVGTFNPSASVDSFSATTIGGLTSLPGALFAGFGVRAAQDAMSSEVRMMSMGVGVLVVLWVLPSGLAGLPATLLGWVTRVRGRIVDLVQHETPLPIVGLESGAPDRFALTTTDLEVSFGQLKVLFGVDIDVEDGEVLALLGTNGAGKSTWLRAVMGLVPSSGTTTIGGVDTSNWSTEKIVRSGVALMVGGKSTFPTMTVAEHLQLAGWTRWGEREALAADRAELIELFPSLERRMSTKAGDLSGGEQQQLALAQTLLLRPKVLLIDELSLGLAPIVVGALLDVIAQIRAAGTTIVIVEQSVNVAMSVAKRAVFMEKGEVRFTGPTDQLSSDPSIMRAIFFDSPEPTGELLVGDFGAREQPVLLDAGTTPAPALSCSGVTKRFGGVLAVDDVEFSVAQREIVGLIGQNGAGKSTFLDCLSGFHRIDGGRILMRTTDISGRAPWERALGGMGRSFQEARLFPGLTVEETIAVARERHVGNRSMIADALRQPRSWSAEIDTEHHVSRIVGELGLERYRDTLTSALSTGTRRVVELACLVASEPRVLLLDEPSAGVAQRDTEALGPLLVRIRDMTGAAVVIVEHDMALLRSICDRLVAFDQGRVISQGAPSDVLSDPLVISAYLGNNDVAIERSDAAPSRLLAVSQ